MNKGDKLKKEEIRQTFKDTSYLFDLIEELDRITGGHVGYPMAYFEISAEDMEKVRENIRNQKMIISKIMQTLKLDDKCKNTYIAIVGSRDINDYKFVEEKFLELLETENINIEDVTIISGGANGVDTIAQKIAKKYGLSIIIHYPDWDKYGKRAGFIRNQKIVNDADIILAVRHQDSKGTTITINIAKSANKVIYDYIYG